MSGHRYPPAAQIASSTENIVWIVIKKRSERRARTAIAKKGSQSPSSSGGSSKDDKDDQTLTPRVSEGEWFSSATNSTPLKDEVPITSNTHPRTLRKSRAKISDLLGRPDITTPVKYTKMPPSANEGPMCDGMLSSAPLPVGQIVGLVA